MAFRVQTTEVRLLLDYQLGMFGLNNNQSLCTENQSTKSNFCPCQISDLHYTRHLIDDSVTHWRAKEYHTQSQGLPVLLLNNQSSARIQAICS